ncbi:uncharacterized protein [Dysidea avara]|uniref:uncharacterized protein isoform X1 n=1 Tax=Dysidea avara TaxID=196820 RepID=UPI0033219C71
MRLHVVALIDSETGRRDRFYEMDRVRRTSRTPKFSSQAGSSQDDAPSYALVKFLTDQGISVVPISKVLKDESKEICTGGIYKVKFSKEELEVVVLALGNKAVMEKREKVALKDSDDEQEEEECSSNATETRKGKKKGTTERDAGDGAAKENIKKRKRSGGSKEKDPKRIKKQDQHKTGKAATKSDFEIIIGNSPPSAKSTGRSPNEITSPYERSDEELSIIEDDIEEVARKSINLTIDDQPPNRNAKVVHKIEEFEKEDLEAAVVAKFEEQKTWMAEQFQMVFDQLHTIMASGVAKALTPLVAANTTSGTYTPHNSTEDVPECISADNSITVDNTESTATNSSVIIDATIATVNIEATTSNNQDAAEDEECNNDVEYLDSDELLTVFIKSQNRHSFARDIAQKIFDVDTLINSNVNGSTVEGVKKPALDKQKVGFIKRKCFQYHETEGNRADEWSRCVKAINDRSRQLKRQKKIKAALAKE